jgi:hypothetical protein
VIPISGNHLGSAGHGLVVAALVWPAVLRHWGTRAIGFVPQKKLLTATTITGFTKRTQLLKDLVDVRIQPGCGDCFAYAMAKESSEPPLFKGGDFAHTDFIAALPTSRAF